MADYNGCPWRCHYSRAYITSEENRMRSQEESEGDGCEDRVSDSHIDTLINSDYPVTDRESFR